MKGQFIILTIGILSLGILVMMCLNRLNQRQRYDVIEDENIAVQIVILDKRINIIEELESPITFQYQGWEITVKPPTKGVPDAK